MPLRPLEQVLEHVGKARQRLELPVDGITNPAWSPDGKQLVFTGLDQGVSDLFTVNTDGTGLRRLTDDRHADLHPAWSPDGQTIAFVTDRSRDVEHDPVGSLRVEHLSQRATDLRVIAAHREHAPAR